MKQRRILYFFGFFQCVLCFDPCPSTDVYFQDKCYDYKRVWGTFDEAQKTCSKLGYNLAKVTNRIQNNAIASFAGEELDETYDSFWIGGSDRNLFGNWTWVDGTPFTYQNWIPGEPQEDRHCSTMKLSDGRWIADNCNVRRQFVCEKNAYLHSTYQPFTCPPCNCKN